MFLFSILFMLLKSDPSKPWDCLWSFLFNNFDLFGLLRIVFIATYRIGEWVCYFRLTIHEYECKRVNFCGKLESSLLKTWVKSCFNKTCSCKSKNKLF